MGYTKHEMNVILFLKNDTVFGDVDITSGNDNTSGDIDFGDDGDALDD